MSIVVVQWDNRSPKPSGKADGLQRPECSSTERREPGARYTTRD